MDGELGERVDDAPDEEEARGDLHGGGEDGGADDSQQRVEDLEAGGGLGPFRAVADGGEDSLGALEAGEGDGAGEDDAPCHGRYGIVEEEVGILDRRLVVDLGGLGLGLLLGRCHCCGRRQLAVFLELGGGFIGEEVGCLDSAEEGGRSERQRSIYYNTMKRKCVEVCWLLGLFKYIQLT